MEPKRLTKQPPLTTAARSRSIQDDTGSAPRRPSGPQSPASDLSRDYYHNSCTDSSLTSSASSVEPSPKLATSKFGAQAQPEPYANRHRFSLRRSLSGRTSDEFTSAPADASAASSTLDSTKASGYQNSLRRPGPPPLSHTSPDPRVISPQLRQSASFSTVDRSNTDITPPRPEISLTATKRYSDEGKTSAPWRKKSGFSSFVNSVLGSPRQVKISAPGNPVHVTHVGFDNETGKFTGLPKEWQRVLQENGIGENEQRKNPQAIYDIMTFYQGEGSNEEDAVWHKFDHARPQDPSQSGLSLLMPNNASAARSHATLSTITSPPTSPRFPSNHGGNFENPRAPPPVPQTIPRSVPASSPPMQFANSNHPSLVPGRPAPPTPSASKTANLIPARAAPPPPPQSTHKRMDHGRPSIDEVSRNRSQSNAADELGQDLSLQRQPSKSQTNGLTKRPSRKSPGSVGSPVRYQQQQEDAIVAAQQALTSKQLDRCHNFVQVPSGC
ncbi:MAG: hypothetical protein Q9169_000777 [Polycauliona sp. 2 TL-2023]